MTQAGGGVGGDGPRGVRGGQGRKERLEGTPLFCLLSMLESNTAQESYTLLLLSVISLLILR